MVPIKSDGKWFIDVPIYLMEDSERNHIVFLNISKCGYNVTIPIEYLYIYQWSACEPVVNLLDMQTTPNKICKFVGPAIDTVARLFNETWLLCFLLENVDVHNMPCIYCYMHIEFIISLFVNTSLKVIEQKISFLHTHINFP